MLRPAAPASKSPFLPLVCAASAESSSPQLSIMLHGPAGSSPLARLALLAASPPRLLSPDATPTAPPGFEASLASAPSLRRVGTPERTPPLRREGSLTRTPPEHPAGDLVVPSAPLRAGNRLFRDSSPPLLASPVGSTPPRPPVNRRKTLAAGFTVPRSSIRINSLHGSTPIATMAEKNLCKKLGVVHAEQEVTELAIESYVKMFQQELPSAAIAALRALFRLDCEHAAAVEGTLLAHGGDGELDHDVHDAQVDV